MKSLGILFSYAVAIFVSAIWRGYVLSILWRWFVVPSLGLPALSVSAIIGISVIVSAMAPSYKYKKDERSAEDQLAEFVGMAAFLPAFYLLIGWIVTLFR